MAGLKRDRVNREKGIVNLQMPCLAKPGQVIRLKHVRESRIDCAARDAMAMADPSIGDAIGDAVFDAMAAGAEDNACDAML